MFLVVINVLFNGFQLMWIYAFGILLINIWVKLGHVPDWQLLTLSYGTVIIFMVMGSSSYMHWCLRILLDIRNAVDRELSYISPLLEEVISNSNKFNNTNYKLKDIKITIKDQKHINTSALGKNTIILTSGVLDALSAEELKAVLALELGHLYNRDSLLLLLILFSGLPTRFFILLHAIYIKFISNGFLNMTLNFVGGNVVIAIIRVFIFALSLPLVILEILGRWCFHICILYLSKRYKYRADKFAADAGYREGLISVLTKINAMQETDNSLLGIIFASNPAPMKRINALDRGVIPNLKLWLFTEVIGSIMVIIAVYFFIQPSKSHNISNLPAKGATKSHSVALKPAKPVTSTKAPVVNVEPWVYIYNTTYENRTSYIIDYKLYNKGNMKHITVKESPKKYKMTLEELEALQ